jgi:hypothetical protein
LTRLVEASPDNFGKDQDVIDVPDGISMHRKALVFEKRPVMISQEIHLRSYIV